MKRGAGTFLGLALFLLFSSSAFSQGASPQPCPEVTEDTLGCEPIAWSQLQAPVPLPDPDTEPAPTPDQQPDQPSS
ncbi:MAG: hypothetical protein WB711_02820, partial [Terriglobales bacterium]